VTHLEPKASAESAQPVGPEDHELSVALALTGASTPQLLRLYSSIVDELLHRRVVRSTNNPVADYAECLTARAFDLKLAGKSVSGYDAVGNTGVRYQVKARRLTRQNGSRQLGFIRGLEPGKSPFDFLVGILFTADFAVIRAALVPVAVVRERVAWAEPVKAWRLILSDTVWTLAGVQDITEEIRAAVDAEGVLATRENAGAGREDARRMSEPIPVEIDDPVLLIRIPRSYEPGMASVELYDCTRGIWKIGVRRERAVFAFAVIDGVVLEIYAIDHWQPAGTSSYQTRKDVAVPHRWEFVGRVAPESVRSRYVGRSVKSYLPRGFQSPTRYVNC
jgi:hypothetical protein